LEEASFSPIPDEQNDEIDEPLSGDQFSQLRFQNKKKKLEQNRSLKKENN